MHTFLGIRLQNALFLFVLHEQSALFRDFIAFCETQTINRIITVFLRRTEITHANSSITHEVIDNSAVWFC